MLSELWFIYKDVYIWIGPGRNVQRMRTKASWGGNRRACFPFLGVSSIAARGQIPVWSPAHVRFVICKTAVLPPRLPPRSVHGPSAHSFRLLHPPGVGAYSQAGELESKSLGVGLDFQIHVVWLLTYLSIRSASPLLSWRFLGVLWELR